MPSSSPPPSSPRLVEKALRDWGKKPGLGSPGGRRGGGGGRQGREEEEGGRGWEEEARVRVRRRRGREMRRESILGGRRLHPLGLLGFYVLQFLGC